MNGTSDSVAAPPAPQTELAGGLPTGVDLLAHLESIFASRGLDGLSGRLGDLAYELTGDLAAFEEGFARLPRDPRLVGRSAAHLLALGGKRLRPMCVVLAARLGSGVSSEVLDLAIAVELVHSATLLHDDVVDLSNTRRGTPSSRALFGNAASVFAGDWLLLEALRRVERGRHGHLLGDLFDTIETMIAAETLQLAHRGRLDTGRDTYFQVVEGKTAALFRWAMGAGAVAGGLSDAERRALESYGLGFGVAFQIVDDLLDVTGDPARTGKALFTDLREGKMSYPLILALEHDAGLGALLEDALTLPVNGQGLPDSLLRRLTTALAGSRAAARSLALARERCRRAVASLDVFPEGGARRALTTVAQAVVDRDL